MLHEFFLIQLVLREEFLAGHPHEAVHFARLRHKRLYLVVGKRDAVDVIELVVEVGAAVKHAFVLGLE